MTLEDVNNEFGELDLSLIDFLLRGLLPEKGRILDAGCGGGRQLLYFLRKGYEVAAVDNDPSAVRSSNFISQSIQKADVAQMANIEDLSFPDNHFDFIICSQVLHFANSKEAWNTMWKELERVLHPEGLLYCVVASILGIEGKCRSLDAGKYEMPNGCVQIMKSK
jgi:SAM-dependent methyltransferase